MGAVAFLNDRYVEVELGPAPNIVTISLSEGVINSEGKIYHTGKYIDGKWFQGVDIELEIKGGANPKPDNAIVRIYNMNLIKNLYGKNSPIIVKAGYLKNFGVIFSGVVKTMSTEVQGQDTVTTFRCDDRRDTFLKVKVDSSWPPRTRWTKIVGDIIGTYTNVPVGYIHESIKTTPERYYINKEKAVKGWLKDILKKLADTKISTVEDEQEVSIVNPDTRVTKTILAWRYFIRQGRFYLLPENVMMPTGLFFTAESGLLSVVQGRDKKGKEAKNKFIIKTLLDWRITKQSVIKVRRFRAETEEFYRVTDFKFISNSKDHDIEIEVKQLKNANDTLEINIPVELDEVEDVEDEEQDWD